MSVIVNIVEISGATQVIGPEVTQQFIISGYHSGDNIVVSGSGGPTNVSVEITESPYQISVTGVSSPDEIAITVEEGIRPSEVGPFDTLLAYNSDGQLVQKVDNRTTDFYYNVGGQLTGLVRTDYYKRFYYSGTFLTGIDVVSL